MTNDEIHPAPQSRRRLERSGQDRMVGGVCAGLAHFLGLDSLLLRVAAVVLVLVSGGTAILAYLVAWMLIPPAADDQRERPQAAAIDAAMTKLGDRLRDPEVRAGARRTANGLSTAVRSGVDDLGRRARRNPPTPGDER